MREHLSVDMTPFDAKLEMVMPGIQERFDGLSTMVQHLSPEICGISRSVGEMKPKIEEMDVAVREVKNEMKAVKQSIVDIVRSVYRSVCERENVNHNVRGHQPGNMNGMDVDNPFTLARRHEVSPSQFEDIPEQEVPEQSNPEEDNAIDSVDSYRNIFLSVKFSSLQELWNEWHGLTARPHMPPGGIAYLEEKYKAKWRSHYDSSQTRHLTRIRLIVKGIEAKATRMQIPANDVIREFEDLWSSGDHINYSPDNMVHHFQRLGYIQKRKSRGRKRKEDDTDLQ